MYGFESSLWEGRKVLFCVTQVVAGAGSRCESSMWMFVHHLSGWAHLLCFTYVCDFWVLPFNMKSEKNNENPKVFLLRLMSGMEENIFHLSNCMMLVLWTWSSSKALVYSIFENVTLRAGKRTDSWRRAQFARLYSRMTWKASENYFKVKYHLARSSRWELAYPRQSTCVNCKGMLWWQRERKKKRLQLTQRREKK